MAKEEKKEKDKSFNVDEFYRKLGVWLLILLLIVIVVIGTVLLILQRNILKRLEPNYTNKSVVKIIDPESLEQNQSNE